MAQFDPTTGERLDPEGKEPKATKAVTPDAAPPADQSALPLADLLADMKFAELQAEAAARGVDTTGMHSKVEVADAILAAASNPEK